MFKVTVQALSGNEFDIYYPGDKDYVLSNAVLTYDVGLAGEFNFAIPFGHPSYDQIVQNSIITVYKDNVEFWRGDIRNFKTKFDKSLEVYCLEDLAWLGDEPLAMVQITNQTYSQRFTNALTSYNGNQVAKRQFAVGQITAVSSSDYCSWVPEYGMSVLDGLRKFIAGANGFLKVRRVTSGGVVTRNIDIVKLSDYGKQSSQTIEFGSNLLDYTKDFDATNIINALYPYGAETETELYSEIMQRISGTPIQNDASISAFGRRAKTVVFDTDNVTTLNNLASAYLSRYSQPHVELEISAVDLGSISDVDDFAIGDSVRVLAPTYAIDQRLYITHMDVDLLNPASNQINLTDELRKASLTSQVATQGEEIKDIRTPASVLDEAKRNALAIFQGADGGIVTFPMNEQEQIIGILIANNLDVNQATKAWGWNISGLVYVHRTYPSDPWQIGIAMTMNGEIVADYITIGEMSADRINGGHIRANLITALNGTTAVGNNTLADFATKASTIVDVDVEYAKNQSSTTAPTSGWSTESPQWEEGYYIWQRTKTTDGNSQASYSDPVCIQGADGQTGPAGVGVSAIVEQYYLSTSDQSPTGGSWSTNQPAWEEGKYIWTRSHVTWTDSTTSDTAPVLAKAINGANEAVKDLDDDLDQNGVFNRLIGGDTAQGIILNNGKLYLRGEYFSAGAITIGGSAYASNPTLVVKNQSNTQIGSWTKDGINITGGSINLANNFIVNSLGEMIAKLGKFGVLNIDSSNSTIYAEGTITFFNEDIELSSSNKRFFYDLIIDTSYLSASTYINIIYTMYSGAFADSIGSVTLYRYYENGNTSIIQTVSVITYVGIQTYQFNQSFSPNDGLYLIRFNLNYRSNSRYLNFKVQTSGTIKSLLINNNDGIIAPAFKGQVRGRIQATDFSCGGWRFQGFNKRDLVFGEIDSNETYLRVSPFFGITINDADISPKQRIHIKTDDIFRYEGSTYYYLNWQGGSDRRIKENITDLDAELSRKLIDGTVAKRFKYIGADGIHYGIIAQEAREVLDSLGETEAVLEYSPTKGREEEVIKDLRAIRYEEYIPHLVNYVKDLRAEIDGLKAEIKALKEEK